MAASNFDVQFQQTMPTILCCMCGTPIPPNPSNMCVNCIRGQVDITDGIQKQVTLPWCRQCGRYLNPPNHWVTCDLESKELLGLCLKKIKGLNKVKLVDAGFVWTEPHSRRVKVKLTIQKEVFTSTILQQVFVVEFVVQNQQCEICQRRDAKQTWNAKTQVRQKVDHKKTFYYLEQLILKHNAHIHCINVKEQPDGIDFFFANKSHATKMVDFFQAVAPIRFKASEKLISADEQNSTANVKHTLSVEIVPVCRDDLVCLPRKLALALGNISPLLICERVTSVIRLLDPMTLHSIDLTGQNYWSNPFRSIQSHKQLIEYIVLDITPVGPVNGKYILSDVQVARMADFGSNDTIFTGRTHLGHLLKPGDYALGYDLSTAIFNDADISAFKGHLPDFILLRKSYPNKKKNRKQRHWKLKALAKEEGDEMKTLRKADQERQEAEYEEFLESIEQDPELRSQMNLYKAPEAEQIYQRNKLLAQQQSSGMADDDGADNEEEGTPEIGLEELLDELVISENPNDVHTLEDEDEDDE